MAHTKEVSAGRRKGKADFQNWTNLILAQELQIL